MMLIILVILSALAAYIALTYHRLLGQIETIRNNEKQIDIQLDRRYKIFESLIHTAKKETNDEVIILKDVIELRAQAEEAKNNNNKKARMQAENQISDIATHLNVVFEQYPVLKTNENCLQLQQEILKTENKLSYARQSYNDSIEYYIASKAFLPTSLIINILRGKLDFDFTCWQLCEQKITEHPAYSVQL